MEEDGDGRGATLSLVARGTYARAKRNREQSSTKGCIFKLLALLIDWRSVSSSGGMGLLPHLRI